MCGFALTLLKYFEYWYWNTSHTVTEALQICYKIFQMPKHFKYIAEILRILMVKHFRYPKTFLYFLKILSQKISKNLSRFLNVPQFSIHLHFFKILPRFTDNFSVPQYSFEIFPKSQNISSSLVLCFLANFSKFF